MNFHVYSIPLHIIKHSLMQRNQISIRVMHKCIRHRILIHGIWNMEESAQGLLFHYGLRFCSLTRKVHTGPVSIYDKTFYSKISAKRWDWYLKLHDRSETWHASQQYCWFVCQISKRCDILNYQSCNPETSWDLKIRRLIGYWNGPWSMLLSVTIVPVLVCIQDEYGYKTT